MASRAYQISNNTTRKNVHDDQRSTSAIGAGKKVAGCKSKEEARKMQDLKYSEDKVKFNEKEREKAEKKRAEKLKRYNHVDLGRKLSDGLTAEFRTMETSCAGVEQNKEIKKRSQLVTGDKIVSDEDKNNCFAFEDLSAGVQNMKVEKEEEFRQQMRNAREQLQKRYDEAKIKKL